MVSTARIRAGVGGAVLAAVLLLAGCGGSSDEPAPSPTTIEGSAVEVTGPLSYTVWSNVLANFPDGVSTSSPLFPVTAVEDITSTSLRVYVQQQLSDDERETVARQIFSLGALVDDVELDTVVVRDASGVDSNHR